MMCLYKISNCMEYKTGGRTLMCCVGHRLTSQNMTVIVNKIGMIWFLVYQYSLSLHIPAHIGWQISTLWCISNNDASSMFIQRDRLQQKVKSTNCYRRRNLWMQEDNYHIDRQCNCRAVYMANSRFLTIASFTSSIRYNHIIGLLLPHIIIWCHVYYWMVQRAPTTLIG